MYFWAEAITTRLDAIAGIKSRGVKGGSMTDSEEDYRLNRNTRCVSCLVELGFMSNANDNRLITEKPEETGVCDFRRDYGVFKQPEIK